MSLQPMPDPVQLMAGAIAREWIPVTLPRAVDAPEEVTTTDEIFDRAARDLKSGGQSCVSKAMDQLTDRLRRLRSSLTEEDWAATVRAGRDHELRQLVHTDPFSRWSYEQPRGYPGDAELIDFIYGDGDRYVGELTKSSRLGKEIYARNRMVPACRAVRFRRDYMAEQIGRVLKHSDSARILSVASGHLREAERIPWQCVDNLDALVALDQDPRSTAAVAASKRHSRILPVEGSVSSIISGKLAESDFDLIYALGLYDYLKDRMARRLQAKLFSRLKSGGSLVVANFLPDPADVGYMETFMDWWLVYRSRKKMMTLLDEIDVPEIRQIETFVDPSGQIGFLKVTRA